MGGTRTQGAVSQNTGAKYESIRAYDLFGGGSRDRPQPAGQSVYLVVSSPTQKVTDPAYAAAIGDIVGQLQGRDRDASTGQTVPVFAYRHRSARRRRPRPDSSRRIFRAPGSSRSREGEGIALARSSTGIPDLTAATPREVPGRSRSTRSATASPTRRSASSSTTTSTGRSASRSRSRSSILLIAFGALVAAFVPLVLAVTALLAAFGILGIYSQLIDPVSPYASQLIVLIGLAVAVDYSLFMVTRARHEWRRGRDRMSGIAIASSTAGRAVFFSGLAVMISIAGLFLLDDPLFRSMAIATIGVVAVSVVGSLTFLPAVLAILGTRAGPRPRSVLRPSAGRGQRLLGADRRTSSRGTRSRPRS